MDKDQRDKLNEPPPPAALKSREQGGINVTYLRGHYIIAMMNEIFGADGWSRGITGDGLREVAKTEGDVPQKKGPDRHRFNVAMLCEYQITIHDGPTIDDVGYGDGKSYYGYAEAYESAAKEALTDALKRCCRSLGNALGNCLYDKEWLKANVDRNPTHPSPENDAPHDGAEPYF